MCAESFLQVFFPSVFFFGEDPSREASRASARGRSPELSRAPVLALRRSTHASEHPHIPLSTVRRGQQFSAFL